MVPMEGVEPTHFHEYQILSLARLPIPPHRLFRGWEYKSGSSLVKKKIFEFYFLDCRTPNHAPTGEHKPILLLNQCLMTGLSSAPFSRRKSFTRYGGNSTTGRAPNSTIKRLPAFESRRRQIMLAHFNPERSAGLQL